MSSKLFAVLGVLVVLSMLLAGAKLIWPIYHS